MNILEIKQAAKEFRSAIEKCSHHLGISFETFPKGSCGDVAVLLGTYLNNLGYGEFQYMLGDYGSREDNSWSSHAWIQSNSLVVDITADQFSEVDVKIIVSTTSFWHRLLKGKAQHKADIEIYDQATKLKLKKMYKTILDNID